MSGFFSATACANGVKSVVAIGKDDLIPGATGRLDSLLVVRERGAAADAVERHADNLAAFLDVLNKLADRVAGDLEHHAGAVGEWLRRRQAHRRCR